MRVLSLLVLASSIASFGFERPIRLTARLDANQVVPPTLSLCQGSGTFVLDPIANTLSFDVSYGGLIGGNETGSHFHGPAAVGQIGQELFTLPLGNRKIGVWSYPETIERALIRGLVYVDVHSLELIQGECRGQILPVVAPPTEAELEAETPQAEEQTFLGPRSGRQPRGGESM